MVPLHRIPIVTTLIIVLIQTPLEAKTSRTELLCPVGFELAFTKSKGEPICYRLKGREKAEDMYRDCVGNLYSIKLYNDLNISELYKIPLWTEYTAAYPDGPFIDWSTGKLLDETLDEPSSLLDETKDGLLFNSERRYIPVERKEQIMYYRFCFVKPYPEKDNMHGAGCEDLPDSWKIESPRPTCLFAPKASGGGSHRANWSQSLEICKKYGSTLLNRSWIYSNIPWLHHSKVHDVPEYPLGVIYYPPDNIMRDVNGGSVTEWNSTISHFPDEISYGLVRDGSWVLTNNSYVFYDVICERPVTLKTIELRVSVHNDTIFLQTNDTIQKKNISCFTDSETFYPTSVKITGDDDVPKKEFILKPVSNGYYWCMVTDHLNYAPSESNSALFIRVEEELASMYAVKIRVETNYNIDNVEKIDNWKDKIRDYIYTYTKCMEDDRNLDEYEKLDDPDDKVKFLVNCLDRRAHGKEKDAVIDVKVKQVYRDKLTILAHMSLRATMRPVPAGTWADVEVLHMRSTRSCVYKGHRFRNMTIVDCEEYHCTGDFNEGYHYIITSLDTPCTTTEPPDQSRQVTVLMPSIPGATKDLPYRENTSDSSDESTERKPIPDGDVTTEDYTKPAPPPPTTPDPATPDPTTPDPTEVVTVNTPTRPPPPTTTDAPTTEPPRPQPEEQLQQVLTDLESLLNDTTAVLSVENITNTFNQVDKLFEDNVELDIPGQLLRLLDDVGGRIELNGSENATTVGNNFALLVADAAPDRPVRGLRLAATGAGAFSQDAFHIIRDEVDSSQLQAAESDVVVQLPESVGTSSRRISFVVFRNDRAFQAGHYPVNSRILSINVENLTQFEHNQYIDIHFTPSEEPNRNESRACAYWEFATESGGGAWSQAGCTLLRAAAAGDLDTCRCDHLTHFAEILIPRPVFSERNEAALRMISVVGCCLSVAGLAAVGLTALLFRSWRRDFSNKIWLQLCVAIFLLVLCFLIVSFVDFQTYDVPCMLIGVALHYATLASFCWMLVAAVLSYRRLVLVFNRDTSHKLLKAAAFAWGAPFAVVGVLLSVDPLSYAGRFEEKTPTGAFCYPSGLALWLTVFAPIIIMLLANWTLFVLIVRSVFASRRVQRHGDSHNDALRCASVSCLLVFLFGLPWVFGLFSFNIVAAYFFTLTATFQGFVLFVFFVLGNKKTRDLWLNKLKIKQIRKVPVTSSTYTNRSTGTSGRPVGPASVQGNLSKPRSLATPDDSRFS